MGSLDDYLAATQLGITLASLGLGWVGEPAIVALIEPALGPLLPEPRPHRRVRDRVQHHHVPPRRVR